MASWTYIGALALVIIYTLVVVLLFIFLGRRGDLKSGLVVLNITLAFYLYHVYFESETQYSFKKNAREGTYVSSQVVNYFKYRSKFAYKHYDGTPLKKVNYIGETGAWYQQVQDSLSERSLLVVNEAWGVNLNPKVNAALLKPLLDRRDELVNLRYGEASFNGYTIAAELRELCSLWPNTHKLKSVETGFEDCLPNRLRTAGYSTMALHGAKGEMYDRINWYPRAGFEQQTFFESKQWPARCVSFPGACDLDLRDEVVNFFQLPGKRFMYWLTLNTHAFYDLADLRKDVMDCEAVDVAADSSTCRYLKLQAQFFYGLAEMASDPGMAGVTVRVIGDHPPALRKASEKSKYFKENAIGWVEFSIPARGMALLGDAR